MIKEKDVYQAVRSIPRGKVATYGQIARLIGSPGHARQVGYVLSQLDDADRVPWHRVINVKGMISQRRKAGYEDYQRILLEDEGIVFENNNRISLQRFQWHPKN